MTEPNHNQSDRSNGLLTGIVIGAVVGAVTALLFAPKKGNELRSDLKDQYVQVSEKSKEVATKVGKKTQEVAGTVSEKSQEIAGKAKEIATSATNELKTWNEKRKAILPSNDSEEVAEEEEKTTVTN